MDNYKLVVDEREGGGTAVSRRLRKSGRVPGVVYGLGRDPRHLSIVTHDMELCLAKGGHVVELGMGKNSQTVLIKSVQWDALGSTLMHVDFQRIDEAQKVVVNVAVSFAGEAPQVPGGIVDKLKEYIEVEVLPMEIPTEFVVNLATLEVGMRVTVGDVEFPEGCVPTGDNPDEILVQHYLRLEEEEEPEDGELIEGEDEETAEPEVIGKGKGSDEEPEDEES